MKAEFIFTPDQHTKIREIVGPALRDTGNVSTTASTNNEALHVTVSADTYARLQGAMNSAVNYVKLADKLLNS